MSIVASVKSRDGIVLAADSAAQIHGETPDGTVGILKVFYNAQKLFQIRELPIGVLTYGVGNIGLRSVQGILTDYSSEVEKSKRYENNLNLEEFASDLAKHLLESYKSSEELKSIPEETWPDLGILIGGYSEGHPHAEEWEFVVPSQPNPKRVRKESDFGASWRGIAIPFIRIFKGFDPRLKEEILSIVPEGLKEQINQLHAGMQAPVLFDAMPIQDAIHFAEFIINTTIAQAQFEIGVSSCGGPTLMAVIRHERGFEWVTQPRLTVSSGLSPFNQKRPE